MPASSIAAHATTGLPVAIGRDIRGRGREFGEFARLASPFAVMAFEIDTIVGRFAQAMRLSAGN